jgi:predicted secreted protein
MRPNDNGDIDHTASGRWRSRIRGTGEEKMEVMEEVNAILKQLVQSYLVQQIEGNRASQIGSGS